jgi:hypothetical protein
MPAKRAVYLLAVNLFIALVSMPLAVSQFTGNGVVVDIEIITGSGSSDCYVGDSFTYNITLTNIGNQTISSNFTVSVYNPSRDLLGSREFREFSGIVLSSGQVTQLFPSKEQPIIKGNKEYDVFFFDTLGSYKLQISSSQNLLFLRPTEMGGYTYQAPLVFYFDAMPRWEKNWRDVLTQWQATNENLTRQTLTMSSLLFRLSYVVGLLTVFNLATVVWSATRRVRDAILVAIVGSVLFVLAMSYLGVFWI